MKAWLALAILLWLALPAWAQTSITLPGGSTLGDGVVRDEIADRLAALRDSIKPRRGGVLGLFGYNVVPDGSANSLQISRGQSLSGGAATSLQLGQLGTGFTWDDTFALYTEGYIGYARYDPRLLLSGGTETSKAPLRWNNVAMTLGVGWDFKLNESWVLRPIINGAVGYAASDLSLFGRFINYKTDVNLDALTNRQVNVQGKGGSLVLAYYDKRPARDIDMELRYTQFWLNTWGNSLPAAKGSSIPQTLGLWTRIRWPMGIEAWGRPMRWVIDNNFTGYIGDQAKTLNFAWSLKVGGGIEFDVGRYEVGAVGLYLSRVRLVAHYFYGEHGVSGYSVGLGMSF